MRNHPRLQSLALIAIAILMSCSGHAQEESWQSLFDGKSLDGWVKRGGEAPYRVEEGAIVGSTVPGRTIGKKLASGTENTFLCTEKYYGDFILELEFKVHSSMNSGVQIRSNSFEGYRDGRVHGYQVEIDPSARAWTGGIYDEARRGWLYDLGGKKGAQPDTPALQAARNAFKQGEWNHFRVEAKGDSIKTRLNGIPVADLKDDMTATGFIALQVHGTKERDVMEVAWRAIRLQAFTPPTDSPDKNEIPEDEGKRDQKKSQKP
jgi:hypothetical protein